MAAKKRNKPNAKREYEKPSFSPRERLMRAMSHPLRYQILTHLNDREWSPNELSDQLAQGLSQVSYHVNVLKGYGLIALTKAEPRRGAVEHFYRATERTIISMDMAKGIPKSGRQVLIGGVLEEVNGDVNESFETGLYDSRDDYHVVRIPMRLDEKGCRAAHDRGDAYIKDMLEVASESAERLAADEDPQSMGVTAVLLVFRSAQAEREKEPPGKKPPKRKPGKRGKC